jgi:hypothetical protein
MKYCVILTLAENVNGNWQAPEDKDATCTAIELNTLTLPNYNQMGKAFKAAFSALTLAQAQKKETAGKSNPQ